MAILTATLASAFHPYHRLSPLVGVAGSPPPRPRLIALTFDDGPSPRYTPEILRLLNRYDAHATFFVLGSEAAQFPQILRDIVNQGSTIANHGYHHVNYFHAGLTRTLQDAALAQALFNKEKIPTAPYYRPPFGNSNKKLAEALATKGYTLTLWSIDTHDWSMPGMTYITRKVLSEAEPGAIVLMHDGGGNRSQTVAALESILPVLRAEGYRLVTLPQYVRALGLTGPQKLPLPPSPPQKNGRIPATRSMEAPP